MVCTITINAVPSDQVLAEEQLPKCLYVSSYHQGYVWSDGIEAGLRQGLRGHCEIRQFDMDTKRRKDAGNIQSAAANVLDLIDKWKPDVVITSDDNAAKFVVAPYYRDSELPFVFCGINWTVEEYGFPYENVTGIVEIAPITPMLQQAFEITEGRNALYIGAETLSEQKNFQRIFEEAQDLNIAIEYRPTATFQDWIDAYQSANAYDFVVLGNHSGIENWDATEAASQALQLAEKLTVTNHERMMPVATLGYTKMPWEHGEWAAAAARQVLSGTRPNEIPLATSKLWDLWVNEQMLDIIGLRISQKLLRKAKKLPIETAELINN